jgi:hypothetical protein
VSTCDHNNLDQEEDVKYFWFARDDFSRICDVSNIFNRFRIELTIFPNKKSFSVRFLLLKWESFCFRILNPAKYLTFLQRQASSDPLALSVNLFERYLCEFCGHPKPFAVETRREKWSGAFAGTRCLAQFGPSFHSRWVDNKVCCLRVGMSGEWMACLSRMTV